MKPHTELPQHLIFFRFNFCPSFDTPSTEPTNKNRLTLRALCKDCLIRRRITARNLRDNSFVRFGFFFRFFLSHSELRFQQQHQTKLHSFIWTSASTHHQPTSSSTRRARFDRVVFVPIPFSSDSSRNVLCYRLERDSSKCRVTYYGLLRSRSRGPRWNKHRRAQPSLSSTFGRWLASGKHIQSSTQSSTASVDRVVVVLLRWTMVSQTVATANIAPHRQLLF